MTEKIKKNENSLSQEFLEILKTINANYEKKFIIHSNLDGQYNGILFEFKKKFKDNLKREALEECIKNASKLRLLAKDVPSKFAIVFLENKKIYIYNSINFYKEIHIIYKTSPSKENKEEKIELGERIKENEIIEYSNGYDNITHFLDKEENKAFLKVEIDRNNIILMADRFYNETNKKKKDFYNELINPQILKYIKPFAKDKKELNEKSKKYFPDLIDCINDIQLKKETGAFYTPQEYCKLSTEMVRDAIKRIKESNINNDYIILDRCAGTGNLEQFFTDEELNHCILSTYEVWEWEVLNERYKSDKQNQFGQYTKLRLIIPPKVFIEKQREQMKNDKSIGQIIIGGDALSEHFITGKVNVDLLTHIETKELNKEYEKSIKILNDYVNNQNCNIIVYENPPFSDLGDTDKTKGVNKNFVADNMKNYFKNNNIENKGGKLLTESANQFIWSAFNYYLLKEDDYLIVYSPCKYFKTHKLISKKQIGYGYIY